MIVLSELLSAINKKTKTYRNKVITRVCHDSRTTDADAVFVCIRGALVDGHAYALSAYNRGCRVFVCEREPDLPSDALILTVPETRKALAELSAKLYDYPHKKLRIIGVTGTKGKTTTALLIRHMLNENGIPTGYIGSNGIDYGDVHIEPINTTPESGDLQRYMHLMVEAGIKCLALEISSQALFMYRVHGLSFDTCIFTNLAHDHIGEHEHPTFEHYRDCKHALFTDYGMEYALYNGDDPHAAFMMTGCRAKQREPFSQNADAPYRATDIGLFRKGTRLGCRFTCTLPDGRLSLTLPIPGDFNVYNATAALAVCHRMGLTHEQIAHSMSTARIQGRFETVDALPDVTFVLDYAHNGVSLTSALRTLRLYEPTRLICLFGSVGGRTEMRRPELGRAAASLADFCILTSDNPDREPPERIIDQIALQFGDDTCPYIKITDRAKAIEYAVNMAEPGDIVLLAGKGHEDYQLICGRKEPFSERNLILSAADAKKLLI